MSTVRARNGEKAMLLHTINSDNACKTIAHNKDAAYNDDDSPHNKELPLCPWAAAGYCTDYCVGVWWWEEI